MQNIVRELSRFVSKLTTVHLKAMKRVMKYMVDTRERGMLIKLDSRWDGKDKSLILPRIQPREEVLMDG